MVLDIFFVSRDGTVDAISSIKVGVACIASDNSMVFLKLKDLIFESYLCGISFLNIEEDRIRVGDICNGFAFFIFFNITSIFRTLFTFISSCIVKGIPWVSAYHGNTFLRCHVIRLFGAVWTSCPIEVWLISWTEFGIFLNFQIVIYSGILFFDCRWNRNYSLHRVGVQISVNIRFFSTYFGCVIQAAVTYLAFFCLNVEILRSWTV